MEAEDAGVSDREEEEAALEVEEEEEEEEEAEEQEEEAAEEDEDEDEEDEDEEQEEVDAAPHRPILTLAQMVRPFPRERPHFSAGTKQLLLKTFLREDWHPNKQC